MVALKAEDMVARGWERQRIKGRCLTDLRASSWDWRMLCLPRAPRVPHLLSCRRRTWVSAKHARTRVCLPRSRAVIHSVWVAAASWCLGWSRAHDMR